VIDKGPAFFRKTAGLAQVAKECGSAAGAPVFIHIHKGLDKIGFDAEYGWPVLFSLIVAAELLRQQPRWHKEAVMMLSKNYQMIPSL
jgi:hypothetical protein